MVQSEMEEGHAAHQRREEGEHPQQPAWRRMQVVALAVLATGLLVAAGVVAQGNGESTPTELGLHVVHLPDGKIEMEYTREARKASFGSSDYAPESQAFREGYAFARQAAPQNNLGPAQQRARFARVLPGPQPEPQGAFAPREPAGVVVAKSDLSGLQGTLDTIGSAQQGSLIQQEQQEQAIQDAEARILSAPA